MHKGSMFFQVLMAVAAGLPQSLFAQLSPSATWAAHAPTEYQIFPNLTYLVASNYETKLDIDQRRGQTAPQVRKAPPPEPRDGEEYQGPAQGDRRRDHRHRRGQDHDRVQDHAGRLGYSLRPETRSTAGVRGYLSRPDKSVRPTLSVGRTLLSG